MDNAVNNYKFAKLLDAFKANELDRLAKQVDDAFKITSDINYKWKDDEQKKAAQVRFDQMNARLEWMKKFQQEGVLLVRDHEALANLVSKWYDTWYEYISNKGKQEAEIMEFQANILHEIFVEMWKALKPLNLDHKPPSGLNL